MKVLLEFIDIRATSVEVFFAIMPLMLIGLIFVMLPWNRKNSPLAPGTLSFLFRGGLITFLGLVLFLQGVKLGFMPVGEALGLYLSNIYNGYALIPFGFILGLTICAAEPTVIVLCQQVEEATSGTIPRKFLFVLLCIGVAVATCLGMTRLVFGWSILTLVIPGYALVIILSCFSAKNFVPIAYDASTVVTGPMVVSFVMAIALGAAKSMEGRNPLLDGFGMVALVAMVPIITVMTAGVLYKMRGRKNDSKGT